MLEQLFTQALGLVPPWLVDRVDFQPAGGEIHFHLRFGAKRAACPVCEAPDQPIHDRMPRRWQHLNFFQYRAYLHADVPRVACTCGKTTQVGVPWANPQSGFTLLFEAYALALARYMTVAEVARLLGVNDQQLWSRLRAAVDAAYAKESFADVTSLHIDETASRRGHKYVSVFADEKRRRVIFATEGKDRMTVSDFASELRSHQAAPEQIEHVTIDFSAAYIAGVTQHLPNAKISFDPFHLVALASQAVDQVRREEVKEQPILRKQRYSLLKDQASLTARQSKFLEGFKDSHLKSARAWRYKEALRDLVRDKPDAATTTRRLEGLIAWAQRSRLEPLIQFGRTLRAHFDGIVAAISQRKSNGFAEGLNSLIQAAKHRARGFRTTENFISIIYLIAGRLTHLPANPMRRNA